MSGERRAIEAQRRLDLERAGRIEGPGPGGDPYGAGWLGQLGLTSNGPRIETGVIVDAVPGAHCYRVQAGRTGYLYCSPGGADGAFGASGVRPIHTYPLFSRVFFLRHPETQDIGTILAAEPHWAVHTANQPADSVWPFVRSGTGAEPAHRYPFEASAYAAASGDVNLEGLEGADLSAGRPYDQTTAGEWGKLTETGVGFFLDPFQTYMRVNESTGVFGFYDDSLLRVAGHNFQLVTGIEELEHLDDEGEQHGTRRRTVYPWERMGLWRFNQVTPGWQLGAASNHGLGAGQGNVLNDPFGVQAGSGYAVREPEYTGQLAAARLYDWSGYLGQGGHSTIAAPAQLDWAYPGVSAGAASAVVGAVTLPEAPSRRLVVNGVVGPVDTNLAVPPNTYGGPSQPGVYEDHKSLAGSHTTRFTGSYIVAKRPSIPVPRPLRTPTDPYGDNPNSGYAPSGLNGNTAPHRVRAQVTDDQNPARRMCLLPDAIAYMFNWENLHPFAYHTGDWAVPPEGAAGTGLVNQRVPDYGTLAAVEYLSAPAPVFVDIDHRYKLVAVYETESVFGMLADGSIVIRDGWGSEIRMGGGQIEFRAAGDIRIHSGRSTRIEAGYDAVVKAHNSVDVSASHGDVRAKAQYNMQLVSGTSGCGGTLIENQAACPSHDYTLPGQGAIGSGLVVRCKNSQIDMSAADVRVALSNSAPQDARIFLDAGPSHSVFRRGKTIVDKVNANGALLHLFDDGGAASSSVNEFTAAHTLINNRLIVNDKAYFAGCVSVSGWVTASQHFASNSSKGRGGTVSQYDGDFLTIAMDTSNRVEYLIDTYGPEFEVQQVPAPGALDAEFSFRTDEETLATAYTYWWSHWEAMAGATSQALPQWVEPVVTGAVSGEEYRPFPGGRWEADGSYAYQFTTFTNLMTGVAIDRDANRTTYETGTPPSAGTGKLSNHYVVTVAPAYQ